MMLRCARLTLRPFTMEDVDALHALWTDAGVRRYLWDDVVIDRDTAADVVQSSMESWADHGVGMFSVSLAEGAPIIGFCGFRRFPPELDWELMYGLAPACWGQGLAVEASQAALEFAFSVLPVDRIWGRTDAPNSASVRVLEKLGMEYEERVTVDGLDTVRYIIHRRPRIQPSH